MSESKKKTIFVVDDRPSARLRVQQAIKNLYDVESFESAEELFKGFDKNPDLILLDITMPDMDGYETLEVLKDKFKTKNIPMPPVIFLTANDDVRSETKGLSQGAVDYITKGTHPNILLERIKTHLTAGIEKTNLYMKNNSLREDVEAKSETIMELKDAILKTMAELVEARDKYTGGHVERTRRYLDVLLKRMREKDEYRENDKYKEALESLNGKDELILQSAQLHDVGKIAIKDDILNKPGKLDEDEFEMMKTHTNAGEKVFEDIKSHTNDHEFLEYARVFAITHHEKWDGTGYPNELKDDNIPLLGRLMAIADVYDAVVSERPYKEAQPHEAGVKAIEDGRGTQFDPVLVNLFLEVKDEFKEIYEDCKSKTSGTDKTMKATLWYCEKIKNYVAEVENIVKANMNGKETPFDPALIDKEIEKKEVEK